MTIFRASSLRQYCGAFLLAITLGAQPATAQPDEVGLKQLRNMHNANFTRSRLARCSTNQKVRGSNPGLVTGTIIIINSVTP